MQLMGAEIVIRCLQEEGVEHVFGYPGGAVLHIYDELFKQNKVKHVLTRHEQGAVHAADGYAWWIARLRAVLELVDLVRIDHFIGFSRAWHVPAGDENALRGTWRPGPGDALFEALGQAVGRPLPIVAELRLP